MYKFIIFLLTLTLALLYWQYRLLRKGKNNLIWLALRMGICLTILVTILVPTYHLPMASPIEILLVDNSYSMASSVDAAWETVSTFEETHQKEKHGILLFSGKTVSIYDDAQSIESLKASFYESYAKSSVTDLASAIGTIENHYGTSQALNITLLTDGYVTEMLPTLEDFPDSWSLTTLPLITDQNIDVALDDLRLLKTAKNDLRQAKSVQLTYTSQMSGNGIFILTSSMGEVIRTDITVEKGKYTIDLACDFSLDADPIKGQLMISGDENPHNNTVKLICPESQKLSFLVISDMNNWD
ncbi:MAG: VWA domain-containing protein, partial [Clostridia bacterium]|nr:VWA domain-containing protein [Clostridia bacterium]